MSIGDQIKTLVWIDVQKEKINMYKENSKNLDELLKESNKIIETLRIRLSAEEFKKVQKEYAEVINRYYQEARDVKWEEWRNVTRRELSKLKSEVGELKLHSEVINTKYEAEHEKEKIIWWEGWKKELYKDKFMDFKTNGKKLTAYLEYMAVNPQEYAEFEKKLQSDDELLFNFMMYWSWEANYQQYKDTRWLRWFDKLTNKSWSHAMTILRNWKKYSVIEKYQKLYLKARSRLLKAWIREEEFTYKWWVLAIRQKRNLGNFLEDKFEKENASFAVYYDKDKKEAGEKCYTINSDVHAWFEKFVNDSSSSLSKLSNKQIARYFSYVYLCQESVNNPNVNSKINWWWWEPSIASKLKKIQEFQNKLANDPDWLVKIADNWWSVGDENEQFSIDKMLQASDAKAIQKLALKQAIEWAKLAMGSKIFDYLKLCRPMVAISEQIAINNQITSLINKCNTSNEFRNMFAWIKAILEKHWVKNSEENEWELFKSIIKAKHVLTVMEANQTKLDPSKSPLEQAKAEYTLAKIDTAKINKNKKWSKALIIKAKAVEKKAEEKLTKFWSKHLADTKAYVEVVEWTHELTKSAKTPKQEIALARTLTNLDKFTDKDLAKHFENAKIQNDAVQSLTSWSEWIEYLNLIREYLEDEEIDSVEDVLRKPYLRNRLINTLEHKYPKTPREMELLKMLLDYRKANRESVGTYLSKVEWIPEDKVNHLMKDINWDEKLDALFGVSVGSKSKLSNIEINNIISWETKVSSVRLVEYIYNPEFKELHSHNYNIKKLDWNKYEINWELCTSKEELLKVTNSIQFLEECWLWFFGKDISSLMRAFRESKLWMRKQVWFDNKTWLSLNERQYIIRWLHSLLLPGGDDSNVISIEKALQDISNIQNSKYWNIENLAEEIWLTTWKWTKILDYQKLKSKLN
jgi:hypothetical protein